MSMLPTLRRHSRLIMHLRLHSEFKVSSEHLYKTSPPKHKINLFIEFWDNILKLCSPEPFTVACRKKLPVNHSCSNNCIGSPQVWLTNRQSSPVVIQHYRLERELVTTLGRWVMGLNTPAITHDYASVCPCCVVGACGIKWHVCMFSSENSYGFQQVSGLTAH